MKKKQPITKEQLDKQSLSPFVEDLSYVRFRDQRIYPGVPGRTRKEFWPNEGVYKTKMKRA